MIFVGYSFELGSSSWQASCGVQAASDVNSPVSGEVTEVNSALTEEAGKVCWSTLSVQQGSSIQDAMLRTLEFHVGALQVNKDPYSEGWLMKVKLSDKGELKGLMDSAKYEDHCAKSEH